MSMAKDAFLRPNRKSSEFTPARGRALVKRVPEDEQVGAIIIPRVGDDKRRRDVSQADVIRCGPGKLADNNREIPCPISVGDRVVLDRFCGHDVEFTDGVFVIIDPDADVHCVVEQTD